MSHVRDVTTVGLISFLIPFALRMWGSFCGYYGKCVHSLFMTYRLLFQKKKDHRTYVAWFTEAKLQSVNVIVASIIVIGFYIWQTSGFTTFERTLEFALP